MCGAFIEAKTLYSRSVANLFRQAIAVTASLPTTVLLLLFAAATPAMVAVAQDATTAAASGADSGELTRNADPGVSDAGARDAGPTETALGTAAAGAGDAELPDCWQLGSQGYAHARRVACLGAKSDSSTWLAITLWALDAILAVLVTCGLIFVFKVIAKLASPAKRGSVALPDRRGFVEQNQHLVRAFQVIAFIPAALLTAAHLYGITSFLLGQSYIADFARPSLVILGMLAVGFLFGGLFGLPIRLIARELSETDASDAPLQRSVEFGDRLEQVADWLTKILLGAGLTQLHSLWTHRHEIDAFFAHATGMINDRPLGVVVGIAALAGGFLLGYVSSLLFMPLALQAGMLELRSTIIRTSTSAAPLNQPAEAIDATTANTESAPKPATPAYAGIDVLTPTTAAAVKEQ